jgi:AcrR family transcriptional regulator
VTEAAPGGGLRPRKAPRQQRSARTVDRILTAAARVFDDAGYRDTTTNEIAATAGVSIGSLYQYFPNKDAILVEIARRHIGTLTGAVDTLLDALAGTPLETVIARVIELLVAQHEQDRMHLLIAHHAPRTPEIDSELQRARDHLICAADRLLEAQIPDRGHRRLTAQMMVAVLDAAIHDVVLRHPAGPERDAAVSLTTSTVTEIALGPATPGRR